MHEEFTESGIPLGKRYESIFDIPADVRPMINVKPLPPKGRSGEKGPGARMGRDHRTYWCLGCDTAVATSGTTWCTPCERERNAAARRATRAAEAGHPTSVTFPIEVLERLVHLTDKVIDNIGDATLEFDRPHMTGGAIDSLMVSTKDLTGFLRDHIRPEVKRALGPRAATAAEVRQRRNGQQSR